MITSTTAACTVATNSWKNVEASRTLIEYGRSLQRPGVLGHLFTRWSKPEKVADWPPLAADAGIAR